MSSVLRLNDISCEIEDRVLFRGLSAEFFAGELVQLLGANGAGKTTLLRIIAGLSSRYEGDLAWGEHAIPSYEFYASLLYLGHSTGVKSSLTPLENLRWYFGLNGVKNDNAASVVLSEDDYCHALHKVGLEGYESIPCFQMSAGQKRRVALARLYLSQAPLWILDEPFTAIDKYGVKSLEQCFDDHRGRGGIVVITSHQDMSTAAPTLIDLADYCVASK